MTRRPYEILHVWQESHRLAMDVDEGCLKLPSPERFELSSQLRRSSRSIPTNLVEGKGGSSTKVYLRHVQIALGSACELDYHLLFARDRKYLDREVCVRLAEGLKRKIEKEGP
jgi:four helix bundle protein